MGPVIDKLILRLVDPQVLGVTDVDQSIVASPAVGMNHAFQADLTANHLLQRDFPGIRNDLCKDLSLTLEDPEDDGFAAGSSSPFAATRLDPK